MSIIAAFFIPFLFFVLFWSHHLILIFDLIYDSLIYFTRWQDINKCYFFILFRFFFRLEDFTYNLRWTRSKVTEIKIHGYYAFIIHIFRVTCKLLLLMLICYSLQFSAHLGTSSIYRSRTCNGAFRWNFYYNGNDAWLYHYGKFQWFHCWRDIGKADRYLHLP